MNVTALYSFEKVKGLEQVKNDLNNIIIKLGNNAFVRILSITPATIMFTPVKGTSKAFCLKHRNFSEIHLDDRKIGNDRSLILRNILLESCNIIYHNKRPVVLQLIKSHLNKNTKVKAKELLGLKLGSISSKDLDEINMKIQNLKKKELSPPILKSEVRKLAFEITEYYSIKYFDKICSHLNKEGFNIAKKNFTSLHQYLKMQNLSGHTQLYALGS